MKTRKETYEIEEPFRNAWRSYDTYTEEKEALDELYYLRGQYKSEFRLKKIIEETEVTEEILDA